MDELIKISWNKNPLIKGQEELVRAAELDRFARFLPNNPTVSYADSDNHSWKTYGVSLLVGLPGKAFALREVDNVVLKSQQSEMYAKKIELAQFVVDRYSACASTKELLAILDVAVKELDILKNAITARYEMGQSTQAERIGIELQHRQANIEYMTLVDQSKVACQKYVQYLNDNELDESAFASELSEDLDSSLLAEMGHQSLDIIRAINDVRLAEAETDVAFWRAAPDLTFSYYRNYYNKVVASPIIPTQWTSSYLVSLNIPLLFPFYEQNEIRRARAQNMIASQRARLRRIESEKLIEDAANSFIRSKQILKKLKNHDLPMAETMLESTFAAYKQGKLGFSELILSKRTWLDLKKEEVNLKLNLITSRLICLSSCERN
jgi:outer membrane protein TolC